MRTALLFLTVLSSLLLLVSAGADYYKVLGVGRKSSDAEIKKAYKKLSKQYHPDKKNGDKDKFVEVARGALRYAHACERGSSHWNAIRQHMRFSLILR